MNRMGNNIFFALLFFAVLNACEVKSEYTKQVEKAVASGERNDSLFLSLYLGMDSKDFYATCWELNKQGLIMQGPGNKSAEYYMDSTFDEPVLMRFYPKFEEGKIAEMPVDFLYEGWAPWNRNLSSDSLMPKVVKVLEEWYSGDFKNQEDKKGRRVYYKIDGNRQILVYKEDSARVGVKFTDIFLENPLNK